MGAVLDLEPMNLITDPGRTSGESTMANLRQLRNSGGCLRPRRQSDENPAMSAPMSDSRSLQAQSICAIGGNVRIGSQHLGSGHKTSRAFQLGGRL